ncbi:MAG: DUF3488 and transglutaminase-like domain-containing protein [Actinobacteria bacterium]|nr:DUF3488 and transglutaminase-like domain-containing protein [Actinomycetota bacterium]
MRGQARWSDALLAAAASWAAMLPIQTLLRSLAWVNPALLITAIVVVTGVLARTVLRNWLAVAAVQLLVGVESIVLMYARDETWYGLPHWGTVLALNEILVEARETIQAYAAPAPTTPGIVLTLSLLALVVVLAVDALAVSRRSPGAAGLALLSAYLVGAANSSSTLRWIHFLLPAALWLLMLARAGTVGLRRWASVLPRTPQTQARPADPVRSFARTAGVLGSVVAIGAIVLAAVVPHFPTRYLADGLGRGTIDRADGTVTLSTTLDLRASLENPSSAPLLRYRTSVGSPSPLRVAVLEDYRPDGQFRQRPQYPARNVSKGEPLQQQEAISSTWVRYLDDLPEEAKRAGTLSATGSRLAKPQIAIPYGATRLTMPEGVEAIEFGEGTVQVLSRAESYDVEYIDIAPTPELLEQSESYVGPDPWAETVEDDSLLVEERARPAIAEALADAVPEGANRFETAVAIQDWLRSPVFTYDTQLAPLPEGSDVDPITHFLQTRVGYCQQFATAMIMMARERGIPARMVIGYLPGRLDRGEWEVRASDAHAWPELYFPPFGWIRFDPTPGSRSGAAPSWANLPESTATTWSASTSASATRSSTRPVNPGQDDPGTQDVTPADRTLRQRIAAISARTWILLALGAGVLSMLVLPVTSMLARRRRIAAADDDSDVIEARWQDLVARIGDLGIKTPPTLTPRQVHSHLTQAAVLDQDTASALRRVVSAVEVARYAAPGTPVADPQPDVDAVFESVDASRSPSVRLRARLLPYAGRAAVRSLVQRVTNLPARLGDELRHRGDE